MTADVPKVLYIAGYGRSGSTVLDVLLGSHPRLVSVGEVVFLGKDWATEGRHCSCGEPHSHCPFWKNYFDSEAEAEKFDSVREAVETRGKLPRLLFGLLTQEQREKYRSRMRTLFQYVARQGSADIVVDSSKSAGQAAGRFWALKNIAGLDVQVIHLVRDGRATLRSFVEKGSNWSIEGCRNKKPLLAERSVTGWVTANTIASKLGAAVGENRYLQVKFENLLRSPEKVLWSVGNMINVDMNTVIEKVVRGESFKVGHNIGGNRVRKQRSIQLKRKEKLDRHPWNGLNIYHRALFSVVGQWLNIELGYEW